MCEHIMLLTTNLDEILVESEKEIDENPEEKKFGEEERDKLVSFYAITIHVKQISTSYSPVSQQKISYPKPILDVVVPPPDLVA